jgi:uncharacterized membrane protein
MNLYFLFGGSIRLDESQSIWVATKSIPNLLYISGQDVQVPLYSLILHFWLQFLGVEIVVARLLSLIFFVIGLFVFYKLIKEHSTETVALVGIAVYSLSPFMLWYSGEARTYSLLILVTIANHLYFLRTKRTNSAKGSLGYFFTTFVGVYTHYFFIFLLLTQTVYVVGMFFRDAWSEKKDKSTTVFVGEFLNSRKSNFYKSFFLSLVVASSLFSFWLVYVYRLGFAAYTQPLLSTPGTFNLIQVFVNFIFGFQNINLQSLTVSLWPLIVAVLFLIFTGKVRIRLTNSDYFLISTFLPVILIFMVSYIRPIFLPRYLIFTTPTLFIILAWTIVNYSRQYFWGITIFVLSLLFFLMALQFSSFNTPVREDYQAAVNYLNTNTTASDIVVVSAPFTVYPIEYYYNGLARIDTLPQWNRYEQGPIPVYTDTDMINQIENYKKTYLRMFVVLSYNQGYEEKIEYYLDNNFEELDETDFASDITVRVLRLRYDVPVTKPSAKTPPENNLFEIINI